MARFTFIAVLTMWVIVASFADRDQRRPLSGMQGRPARKAKRFIINGEDAIPHEFPWTVYLSILTMNRTVGSCTGSLISPRVVLTASHCVKYDKKLRRKQDRFDALLVGIYPGWHKNPWKDLVQRESKPIEVAPIYSNKFISPPLPKSIFASYSFYDYGVVILSKPLKSGKRVQFIPFADSNSPSPRNLMCYSAGFGIMALVNKTLVKQLKNESDKDGLKKYKLSIEPDVLQKERYRIQSAKRCNKLEYEALRKIPNMTEAKLQRILLARRLGRINGSVICGLSTGATSGIYFGDSGGPLMCRRSSGPWMLYGVSSSGIKGTIRLAFFANVPVISQWLKKIVAMYDPEYASGFNMGSSSTSMPSSNRFHGVKAVIKASGQEKWSYNMELSVKSKRNANTKL